MEQATAVDEADTRPYGVLELVNIVVKEVEVPRFGTMPLETGDVLVHASVSRKPGGVGRPACGTVTRRVTPTGWLWVDAHNDQYPRCAACLALHPLPTSN
jgi:hypothetical protein